MVSKSIRKIKDVFSSGGREAGISDYGYIQATIFEESTNKQKRIFDIFCSRNTYSLGKVASYWE